MPVLEFTCLSNVLLVGCMEELCNRLDTGLDSGWLKWHFTPCSTHWAAWPHGMKWRFTTHRRDTHCRVDDLWGLRAPDEMAAQRTTVNSRTGVRLPTFAWARTPFLRLLQVSSHDDSRAVGSSGPSSWKIHKTRPHRHVQLYCNKCCRTFNFHYTLSALAWQWTIKKWLKMLHLVKPCLGHRFHLKIPPQKLSMQCGELAFPQHYWRQAVNSGLDHFFISRSRVYSAQAIFEDILVKWNEEMTWFWVPSLPLSPDYNDVTSTLQIRPIKLLSRCNN